MQQPCSLANADRKLALRRRPAGFDLYRPFGIEEVDEAKLGALACSKLGLAVAMVKESGMGHLLRGRSDAKPCVIRFARCSSMSCSYNLHHAYRVA